MNVTRWVEGPAGLQSHEPESRGITVILRMKGQEHVA
jgi:hypothetical protein